MFDPFAGQWEAVPGPDEASSNSSAVTYCAVVGGRICVWTRLGREGLRFEPRTKKWEVFGVKREWMWKGQACVVHGILYFFQPIIVGSSWIIRYFDDVNEACRELKGVRNAFPSNMWVLKMVNLGGKLGMMVITPPENGGKTNLLSQSKVCWYVEIEINKNSETGDMWGQIKGLEKISSPIPELVFELTTCISVSL